MLPDTPDGDEIKAWKSKMAELLVADTDEDMRLLISEIENIHTSREAPR